MKIACDFCERVVSVETVEAFSWKKVTIGPLEYRICGKCTKALFGFIDSFKESKEEVDHG